MTGRWAATWLAGGLLFLLTLGLIDARDAIAPGAAPAGGQAAGRPPEESVQGLLMLLGMDAPDEPLDAVDFELPSLDGRTVRLADLRGQVALVNFWATWCPPCRAEMPAMDRVFKELAPRGLTILAVDYKEPADVVREYVTGLGLSFPILLDEDGEVADELYPTAALPTTYVVDRRGRVIARKVGFVEWDGGPARALLEALLAEPVPPS